MKIFQYKNLLFSLLLVLLMGACGTQQPQLVNPSSDATATGMRFQNNDKSPNLSSAVFVVNNVDSIIFNPDSLPYGTRIDSVVTSFTFSSSSGYIVNDTIPKYATSYTSDTVRLNFNRKNRITNIASDTKTKMTYKLKVNVHQVEAYLHVWDKLNNAIQPNGQIKQKAILLNGKYYFFSGSGVNNYLYSSSDAATWKAEASPVGLPLNATLRNMIVFNDTTAFLLYNNTNILSSSNALNWKSRVISNSTEYNFINLLFVFKGKLWAIAQNKADNSLYIASSANGATWEIGSALPSDFPVNDYAAIAFTPRLDRESALVVGGYSASGTKLNSCWLSDNGSYWVNLQKDRNTFSPISGSALAFYGSKLLLIGGTDANNKLVSRDKQLLQSIDKGFTWAVPDTLANKLPDAFTSRTNTSAFVNTIADIKNKRLFIIGGHGATDIYSDVWKIRVNFYDFVDPSKY